MTTTDLLPIITTSWRTFQNPGDTFIGEGVRYLCEEFTGRDLPWLLVPKFGPDMWRDFIADMAASPVTIYAGTPQYNNYSEWCQPYDDELWRDVINPNRISTAVLAGGSGATSPDVSPDEWARELSDDPLTVRIIRQRTAHARLFTVRDRHAKALLDRLDIPSTLLPCTAIYAGDYTRLRHRPVPRSVAIVPNRHTSDEDAAYWVAVARLVRDAGYDPHFVCHWRTEYDTLRRVSGDDRTHGDPVPIYYTSGYYSLLKHYTSVAGIISARLHGTLTAWGMGVTSAVNITIDSRGYAACECGITNHLIGTTPADVVASFIAADQDTDASERRARIKRDTLESYRRLLATLLEEYRG